MLRSCADKKKYITAWQKRFVNLALFCFCFAKSDHYIAMHFDHSLSNRFLQTTSIWQYQFEVILFILTLHATKAATFSNQGRFEKEMSLLDSKGAHTF